VKDSCKVASTTIHIRTESRFGPADGPQRNAVHVHSKDQEESPSKRRPDCLAEVEGRVTKNKKFKWGKHQELCNKGSGDKKKRREKHALMS